MVKKKIAKWIDGDTGIFTDGEYFRLARVRAPEKNQNGGKKATKEAARMSGRSNGVVDFKKVGIDKYGRSIVEMINKDGSINDRLIKKGYKNKGR